MKDEILVTAIEDIRARHDAVRDLIMLSDQQALGLLQIFIPVASASATGAVLGLMGATLIPIEITVSLGVVTLLLLAGSLFCIMAMKSATVGLPGRDSSFWRWAFSPEIDTADIIEDYFSAAERSIEVNRELNRKTARPLNRAKLIAACTPLAALMAGAITWLIGFC